MSELDCPQVKTDQQWPFWWPSWLVFIGQNAYSNLSERLIKVMHL